MNIFLLLDWHSNFLVLLLLKKVLRYRPVVKPPKKRWNKSAAQDGRKFWRRGNGMIKESGGTVGVEEGQKSEGEEGQKSEGEKEQKCEGEDEVEFLSFEDLKTFCMYF